jgi:hypothetical protein
MTGLPAASALARAVCPRDTGVVPLQEPRPRRRGHAVAGLAGLRDGGTAPGHCALRPHVPLGLRTAAPRAHVRREVSPARAVGVGVAAPAP